nr:hypothetical protein 43 [Burkholderiaceae bacterium]
MLAKVQIEIKNEEELDLLAPFIRNLSALRGESEGLREGNGSGAVSLLPPTEPVSKALKKRKTKKKADPEEITPAEEVEMKEAIDPPSQTEIEADQQAFEKDGLDYSLINLRELCFETAQDGATNKNKVMALIKKYCPTGKLSDIKEEDVWPMTEEVRKI